MPNKLKSKRTPLKSKAEGLKKFKTEERQAEYLKKQYWKRGKTLAEIGKECGVSGTRIQELFIKFHIRSRRPGEK